jgi:hypothetical protein
VKVEIPMKPRCLVGALPAFAEILALLAGSPGDAAPLTPLTFINGGAATGVASGQAPTLVPGTVVITPNANGTTDATATGGGFQSFLFGEVKISPDPRVPAPLDMPILAC